CCPSVASLFPFHPATAAVTLFGSTPVGVQMRMRTIGKVLLLAMAVSGIAAFSVGQTTQKPKFEVASIKRSTVLPVPAEILQQIAFSISGRLKGGRLVAQGITVRGLMRAAYAPVSADSNPLLEGQIVGGPAWIGTDLFDIEAKA